YVEIFPKTLEVEINVAIDEGLWNIHINQTRTATDAVWPGHYSSTAANVNAFEINGHLETSDADNPYTETVRLGLRRVFTYLARYNIGVQTLGNPDSNGNGFGIYVPQYPNDYQVGIMIDCLIATGTPAAIAPTGPVDVIGRSYKDIVQDMVDYYAFAQYDGGGGGYPVLGGWRYSANQFPDNSAAQWAAVGLIPAEHIWGCTVPAWVKPANLDWLRYSQDTTGADAGVFGYTGPSPIFGPFGTTPSGMVQLAMVGVGRGNIMWDRSETFMRDNFGNAAGEGQYWLNVKEFYYGLFAFVKCLLLHDANGDGTPEPILSLQSATAGVTPLDWYSAQAPPFGSDPTDGVARSLLKDQNAAGGWSGHTWTGETDPYATAWAIIMLRRTIFDSGNPVAVAKASPNPAVAGQIIQLDGADSFHQDPAHVVDSWEWDLDNNGTYDVSGPFPTVSFPVVGDYPVKLLVTDDSSPELVATTTITIRITTPPIAPTADADGPYNFCEGRTPWFLDATGSVNPDEGQSEPGQPGDTIQSYEWDLDGDGQFDDATGAQPDVTAFFTALGPGSHLVQVRVTDTTGTSYPSSTFGDLSDTDSAIAVIKSANDPDCDCVDDLAARAKPGKVQLTWGHTGADHYNVYRGTIAGGPYLKIGSTASTYSTYLDTTVVNGTTYYYVVRPADALDRELCQSNEAGARPSSRR
ncbi:MAG: hypothetical protein ACKVYV_19480, partial [Limisphaerales bacterium]